MRKPIIFCIDDDPQVLRALTRDLKVKYKDEYSILSTSIIKDALSSLLELKNKGETVSLFITDQRMPEMEGVDFLEKAMIFFPDAKKILLTAYSDTTAAIRAINCVRLDYYLVKPWDPPEVKLYPIADGLLDDWNKIFRPNFTGIKLIGYQYLQHTHEIKSFLAGNLVPYEWYDIEIAEEAAHLLEINRISRAQLPVVFFEDGSYLSKPTIIGIAEKIGLTPKLKQEIYDVVIIGGGPAGLAAGVYGSSEGLKTLLIEKHAPGGQAGTSSRIENYLGFPTGLSGAELTARATMQAVRLGTEFLLPQQVKSIDLLDGYKRILLGDDSQVYSRSVIITTGVDYFKLNTKGIAELTGAGIYYGSSMTEAIVCRGKEVFVVGGGNSAGQAAMHLSHVANHVYILIRKEDLKSTMSAYLIDQISQTPNIRILNYTEIKEAQGEDKLERLTLINLLSGVEEIFLADALYIFIGAKPCTDWIRPDIIKNEKGFLETGRGLHLCPNFKKLWKQPREPYPLETSCPGIFAAGDVRAGAMNRVASAVGEGSMAISFVHQYLDEVK